MSSLKSYLQFNLSWILPLCEIAFNTEWRAGYDKLADDAQTINFDEIKLGSHSSFKNESLFGIAAILATADMSAEYYLVMIPQRNASALLYYIKKQKDVTCSIDRSFFRHGGIEKHFAVQGEIMFMERNFCLLLSKTQVQFHQHLLNGAKQVQDVKGLWDLAVTGKRKVSYSSKIESARKQKKLETVFVDDDISKVTRTQDMAKKNQSHILPKDVMDLLHSEQLQSTSEIPIRNTLRSKDSGGVNNIISLVPHSENKCDMYLSDYHLATEIVNAYSIPHNQETILRGLRVVSDALIRNGHHEDSPTFTNAIGAVSDKYFEGIEHRMLAEQSSTARITDMTIDIDQVRCAAQLEFLLWTSFVSGRHENLSLQVKTIKIYQGD
jgi:hypothetical protein